MSKKRILIIEDNPTNSELMFYLMSSFGHEALMAPDGEQGLELARDERPDLIICDIQLPGIDGYGVARTLKATPELAHIPLVALTANAMIGDRERVLEAGFDAYIAKPVEPEQVMRFLEGLLGDQPTPPPHDGAKGRRVLVADDRSVNLELKRSILEPLGYQVVTVSTMADALGSMEKQMPDLVISDINMGSGQADGFEFLKRVRGDERFCKVPFIMITSTFPDEGTRRRALGLGATRFVVRPLGPEQVLAEVEHCLRKTE